MDNTLRIIYVQSKALKGHVEKSKEDLNCALKEANDVKPEQGKEKNQVIDLQARMYKTVLNLATLKSSTRSNMQKLRE